eukprot:605196-Hanusia_phi.AAC.1
MRKEEAEGKSQDVRVRQGAGTARRGIGGLRGRRPDRPSGLCARTQEGCGKDYGRESGVELEEVN